MDVAPARNGGRIAVGFKVPGSGLLGMLALIGALVWSLMDTTDRSRPRVLLLIAMAVSYGRQLQRSEEPSILLAFAAQLIVGPLLYALAPACGPVYAFPGFPLNPEPTAFRAIALRGDPNAMPSLHMSTAFLL